MLSRHRTILHKAHQILDQVHFVQEADEDGHHTIMDGISISRELWEDFDEPEQITISVEPGDLLNVKEEEKQ